LGIPVINLWISELFSVYIKRVMFKSLLRVDY
jgi:hypothetical protein